MKKKALKKEIDQLKEQLALLQQEVFALRLQQPGHVSRQNITNNLIGLSKVVQNQYKFQYVGAF